MINTKKGVFFVGLKYDFFRCNTGLNRIHISGGMQVHYAIMSEALKWRKAESKRK